MNHNTFQLARIAYDAYCTAVGGKAFNGDDLPAFDDVPQRIKDAWIVAATAVADKVREESR
ncbi:hypothetical protein Ade02nite_20640 [Paractinoplanes deccanensis]|uniref:Uncharacterized protein n=1 Tax=Paractinoplanes deccanensis TaxID=113561 RepID=A0ABQ3Y0A5_9ACTN|nr:hypothetical protein [Actinoplanes deccanensis]GID73423.1 hypothetical protein Ade02nite_20640 [Actinoplanes deccanensis]